MERMRTSHHGRRLVAAHHGVGATLGHLVRVSHRDGLGIGVPIAGWRFRGESCHLDHVLGDQVLFVQALHEDQDVLVAVEELCPGMLFPLRVVAHAVSQEVLDLYAQGV